MKLRTEETSVMHVLLRSPKKNLVAELEFLYVFHLSHACYMTVHTILHDVISLAFGDQYKL
jgi:hypothetical protein